MDVFVGEKLEHLAKVFTFKLFVYSNPVFNFCCFSSSECSCGYIKINKKSNFGKGREEGHVNPTLWEIGNKIAVKTIFGKNSCKCTMIPGQNDLLFLA